MRFLPALAVVVAAALAACTPTYNWRDARFPEAGLVALLPCKPDQGRREVSLGERPAIVSMQGCEAGGALFAVAWADAGEPAQAPRLLAQWRASTLANANAQSVADHAFTPTGAQAVPGGGRIVAEGRSPQGEPLQMQAAWFVRGRHVFQAVIYAPRLPEAVAEPFFSGLKLS
ncbi:MAG: hypothetical protein KA795_11295 [Burkholderiaceae bacterium]|nr:hypothetical protein [Burkholderiaceae bacterium]